VKDVPADSKEGKQALHSSVDSDSSDQKTTSTSMLDSSSCQPE